MHARPLPSTMPSPPPSSSSSSVAPLDAMPADKRGEENATGCLPADQPCFSLLASSPATSPRDAAAARVCCATASSVAVLGISFGSLLAVLLMLCAIRCYLVRRSTHRQAEPGLDKERSAGLDAAAIAALPELVYRRKANGEEEEEGRECTVCLGAMADGEAARRLPRCAHMFHRGCVDAWLWERSTCPVCRAEVAVGMPGEVCADGKEKAHEASGVSQASASYVRPHERMEGERDLEAQ